MQQLLLRIHGRVQGVGFRYWTRATAVKLGISGWVRNMPDGTVQTYACGTQQHLDEFVQRLWDGSQFSSVTAIDIEKNDTMLSTGTPAQPQTVNAGQPMKTTHEIFSIRYDIGDSI